VKQCSHRYTILIQKVGPVQEGMRRMETRTSSNKCAKNIVYKKKEHLGGTLCRQCGKALSPFRKERPRALANQNGGKPTPRDWDLPSRKGGSVVWQAGREGPLDSRVNESTAPHIKCVNAARKVKKLTDMRSTKMTQGIQL